MSQFPYLVGPSGLPINHIPLDRYNYSPQHRAQPDLSPDHWLITPPEDYTQQSGHAHLVPQYSTINTTNTTTQHHQYNYTRTLNNDHHASLTAAAHPDPAWQVDPVPERPSRVVPINPTDIAYPTQLNYHVVPPSASPQLQSQSQAVHPPPTLHPSLSRSPSHWDDDLYRIPESHSSGRSSVARTPSTPLVKMEQDDSIDPFVMEPLLAHAGLANLSQSLAPPTEVPLRATQASPPMRRMMSVFRLNPFSIHSGEGKGVVQATWSGGEAHALDEEPLVFEFQLKLDSVEEPEAAAAEPLRTFSPDFELHDGRGYGRPGEWADEYQTESVYTTSTPPTWELEYPASSEGPYSPSGSGTHSRASSTSRLHHVASHPYLRKGTSREASESYDQHHAGAFVGRDYMHRTRVPDAHSLRGQAGARAGPSRSSTYNFDDSPGFNPSLLPSVTSANARRWSLPDNPPYPHAPFLVQG